MEPKPEEVARSYRISVSLPVVKTFDEVRELVVHHGKSDFNVDCVYWRGGQPVQPPYVVQILSFGNAAAYSDKGYYIFADSVDELEGYISFLAEQARSKGIPIIYVRVHVEGMNLTSEADRQARYFIFEGGDT